MLDRIIASKSIKAEAYIGFWPCNSNNSDDIIVYQDESKSTHIGTFRTLR